MSPSPYAGLLPLGPRLRFGGGLGLAPSHAHLPLWAGGEVCGGQDCSWLAPLVHLGVIHGI